MIPFAVFIEGVTEEGQGQWVLAVDPVGERLLIVHDDGGLRWHPLADCRLVKVISPEAPRLVVPVQPVGQSPSIAIPNRAERRSWGRNGG